MRFTPQSEEEVQKSANKFGPWPNGIYDFEVSEGSDETSRNGNDMIKLVLHVYNSDGDRRTVFDFLLESIPHKLRHACAACGLMGEYDSGQLKGDDFYGKTGRLKLAIQPEKDGYPAKNVVRDYLEPKQTPSVGSRSTTSTRAKQPVGGGSIDDDSIPFAPCWQ